MRERITLGNTLRNKFENEFKEKINDSNRTS